MANRIRHPDYFLLTVFAVLSIAGLVILTSASSDLGKIRFNDSYYYLKHQFVYGVLFGAAGFLAGYKFPLRFIKKGALPLYLLSVILLILVFTKFGITENNSSRWLHFGSFRFQPGEIAKLGFIIYLCAWLSGGKHMRERSFKQGLLPLGIICGIIGGLLFVQPATSTTFIILMSGFIVYFASGARLRYVLAAIISVVLIISALTVITPYRMRRITTFINHAKDTKDAGYHIDQALIAIGSGGLRGVGYGQSVAKVKYLPAPIDDSIFAISAEELGFIGSTVLVVLFALLVFRLLYLVRRTNDRFSKLLLIGFASIIGLQSIINMAAISGLFPLTGVPLPFISYGGTALAVFITMAGISLNISKNS